MSTCIKHGLVTKHRYKKGLCLNCGRVKQGKKEIISASVAGEPKASAGSEQLQTTSEQQVTDKITWFENQEQADAWVASKVNLTDPNNKDSI